VGDGAVISPEPGNFHTSSNRSTPLITIPIAFAPDDDAARLTPIPLTEAVSNHFA
jgi:hypothetical protein